MVHHLLQNPQDSKVDSGQFGLDITVMPADLDEDDASPISKERNSILQRSLPQDDPTFLELDEKEPLVVEAGELASGDDLAIETSSLLSDQPTMSVEPGDELSQLVIFDHEIPDLPPQMVISSFDLVRNTLIHHPIDQAQVGHKPIDVSGEAEPNSQLILDVGGFRAQVIADVAGKFTFQGVRLQDGWNEVWVKSLTYPDYLRCRAMVQVFRQTQPLLFVGQKDIYTQGVMTADDEVVRCRRCGTFAKLESWQHHPGCARWRCSGREYWTQDDPQFYEENESISL